MISLSGRLKAVYDMVPACGHAADIGTDHAYIPIALCERGKAAECMASDINEGPLLSARKNVESAGLSSRIRLRRGYGLETLEKGNTDAVVIAGMGGDLMINILSSGRDMLTGDEILILQPQSKIPRVRIWLRENGYLISDEDMVIDCGKYYTVIKAEKPEKIKSGLRAGITRTEENGDIFRAGFPRGECEGRACDTDVPKAFADELGPVLLRKKHPVLAMWVRREIGIQESILKKLSAENEEHRKRIAAAEEKKELLSGALDILEK